MADSGGPMFGLVAQVSLSDRANMRNPKVFRFAANEQFGDAITEKYEDKDKNKHERHYRAGNNTRIVFHTTHRWDTTAIKTAQVDIYNLNDETWNWVQEHGGRWENGNLSSNLYLKLDVGWDGFGAKETLETIFNGNVNSFFATRDGRDNVFHFFCGMMPKLDDRTPVKPIPRTPTSALEAPWGVTRKSVLTDLFIEVLAATGYAADQLGLNYNPTAERLREMYQLGEFKIEFPTPLYDKYGDKTKSADAAVQQWLNGKIVKTSLGMGDAVLALQRFCQREGCVHGDWTFSGAWREKVEFVKETPETVITQTGKVPLYEPQYTPIATGKSEVLSPTFYLPLRRGNLVMASFNDDVPDRNVIVNYEMLTQDPQPTDVGVTIHSLMRPWIHVESRIKLAIVTSPKDLKEGQVKNVEFARPETAYTAGMSAASNYYMAVWGTKSAVFETTLEEMKKKRKTASFFNIPLIVFEVQHIGDTYGTKWHSQITTYAPGVAFGV